jgi:hypothetical protein
MQAPRIGAGAPTWHLPEVIATVAKDSLTAAVHAQRDTEAVLIAEDTVARRLGFLYAVSTTDPLNGEPHTGTFRTSWWGARGGGRGP